MSSSQTLQPAAAGPGTSLDATVRRALESARAAGAPVLLCYAAPLRARDALEVLQASGACAAFRFYWEQRDAGFALAGGGAARRFAANGEGRFRVVAPQVERALAGAVCGAAEGADCDGPYAVGGFSFFEAVAGGDWPGFLPALLVVPAWLVRQQGRRCTALVTHEVRPQDSPHALATAVSSALEQLQAAAARAPGEEPGVRRNRAFRREAREDERANWIEVVRSARERIREGRLSKVVLARALDLVCEEPPSPFGLLHRLRAAYPECYAFLVDAGAGQAFLGATPERMARFANGTVDLAAMAGTAPRGSNPAADGSHARYLLGSRKEREEHQIVVDGILGAVEGLGTVEYPREPELVRLSNVQHLCTPIRLALRERLPMLALLERLHPTPAVGGHPRDEAFRLIHECERFERGWYGAPVGWMNARGQGEFAVALRAGTLAGQRLRLFAGGGIVADSDPEREFEETQIKFQPLLSALASE